MIKLSISHEQLKELLHYDPSTGKFTWLKSPARCVKAGSPAGYSHTDGRTKIGICGKTIFASRLAWFYVHGVWPKNCIDHINCVNSDDRIANLRDVSHAQNLQNQAKGHVGSRSGLLGASPSGYRWRANIRINGTVLYLGCFSTELEAHEAYIRAKHEHHPFGTI